MRAIEAKAFSGYGGLQQIGLAKPQRAAGKVLVHVSVGNATYQLAQAQGAGKVISTASSAAKAAKARELGFENAVNLSTEGLAIGRL
jgi:NADPH:quinone reductase